MYCNIRGLKSKEESLKEIMEEQEPTMVCITETHLKEEDKLEFENYKIFRNDRKGKDGGGVLIALDKKLINITIEVARDNENCETLWLVMNNAHGGWGTNVRIGVVYAPQESRTNLGTYKEMYNKIEEQIEIGGKKKQKVLIVGDFNCKVGKEIANNHEEVTKSAKYLLKMRDRQNLKILNSDKRCKGLWTRVQGTYKSVLDYVLVAKEDQDNFISMLVDECKEYAPAGINEMNETVYSDHNTIICDFNWLVEEEEKLNERRIITKKGYTKIENEIKTEKVSKVLEGKGEFEDRYGKWKEKMNEIFKKHSTVVKRKNKPKTTRELLKARRKIRKQLSKCTTTDQKQLLISRTKMINEYIQQNEHDQYRRKISKVVEKLKSKGGINGANTWEVMKQLKGRKTEKPTSIWSKHGEVLEKEEEILERHKEHFYDLLQTKTAVTEEGKENEKFIEKCAETILRLGFLAKPKITKVEEVETSIAELKKRKCCDGEGWKNEHILYGGKEMVRSLHLIFTEMETKKIVPMDWNFMMIKSVHKKGPMQDMNKKRGLFLTNVLSKVYEKVLKKRNKSKIDRGVSECQIGGKKGRGTQDLIILLADLIRRNRMIGKKTYLVFGDAVKCFDKLWLKDCIVELYKMGIAPDDLLMLYLMNENAKIKVKTPIGETDVFEVREIVKQGTIWGPEMCCVETDAINRVGENCTTAIGDVLYGILGYVDDVMGAGSADKIRTSIRNMRWLEKLKKYTFGLDKTKYMVINTGEEEEEIIEEEVEGGKVEKTEEQEYLGFWVNTEGDCETQIKNKSDALMGEVSEIKKRACKETVGNLYYSIRLFLYEACIVPSMLHELEAWGVSNTEIVTLEKVQGKIICNLLEIPRTSPYWGILHETGIWTVRWRLVYRQLMLFHSILQSDDKRMVKGVVRQQKGEEGSFYEDTMKMANELEIVDVQSMEKSELKKKIKTAVKRKMEEEIQAAAKGSTKLRFLDKVVEFKQATYFERFESEDVNLMLKIRLNMVDIYANFKGDIKKKRLCVHCNISKDTTEHLVECPNVYGSRKCSDILGDTESRDWPWILQVVRTNLDSR